MIPDKIYIDIIEDEDGYLFSESLQDNGGEAYIRKDALLEVIEEYEEEFRKIRISRTATTQEAKEADLVVKVLTRIKSGINCL